MIKSAIIAAGGRGTRLMPSTKEQPKEMLPIVDNGKIKPILNLIVEQIQAAGINKMFIVTGRDKRAIEDHFTPNYTVLEHITNKESLQATEDFYQLLNKIKLLYINQPRPDGFGDATELAKDYLMNDESVYVTSGDSIVYSFNKGPSPDFINRFMKVHEDTGADATLAVFETDTPQKYGVVLGDDNGDGTITLTKVVEKPSDPVSNQAICAKYIFKPVIFHALEKIGLGHGGEKQLTDAIQWMIEKGFKVVAMKLKPDEFYMDIGNPKTYVEAFITTSMFDPELGKFTRSTIDSFKEKQKAEI